MSKHPFHLVSQSPWPLTASLSAFLFACGLVLSWYKVSILVLFLGLIFMLGVCISWWSSVIIESTLEGIHTIRVQAGLRLGMLLFIVSEVFFFLGFFWAYLHCSLSPNVELGSLWPPTGITPLNYFHLPFLNTVVLLCSGATITWAHSSLKSGAIFSCFHGLCITLFLGIFFTLLQGLEYRFCSFCISDGAYGSCFYLATGFHGIHVLLGSVFLMVSLFRLLAYHYTPGRHLGFEFACWYWHFVDVVWLFLYLIIYI